MKLTVFKYVDRNKKDSIVLIPGWATDYRIFNNLDLDFNYVIPTSFSPWGFIDGLTEFLIRNKITKISLLGYSLGGFIAGEFSWQYPNLIDEIFLISIRKRYKPKEMEEARKNLKKNKKAYLYKFYSSCFYQKDEIMRFKDILLKSYLDGLDLDYLFSTLNYLQGSEIKPELLRGIKKIKIIHGEKDKIAPIREAIEIKNNLDNAKLITIKDTGHNPFFKEGMAEWIKRL